MILPGWIGGADEVQRMENEGRIEGLIQYDRNLVEGEDPENDTTVEAFNEQGAKVLKEYREWKAKKSKPAMFGRLYPHRRLQDNKVRLFVEFLLWRS